MRHAARLPFLPIGEERIPVSGDGRGYMTDDT
jgi:hypothetical protein